MASWFNTRCFGLDRYISQRTEQHSSLCQRGAQSGGSLGKPWAGRPSLPCVPLSFTLQVQTCSNAKPRAPVLVTEVQVPRPAEKGDEWENVPFQLAEKNALGHCPLLDNYILDWSPSSCASSPLHTARARQLTVSPAPAEGWGFRAPLWCAAACAPLPSRQKHEWSTAYVFGGAHTYCMGRLGGQSVMCALGGSARCLALQ